MTAPGNLEDYPATKGALWILQHRHTSMQISRDAQLRKKEVDDVLGGSDAWKNVQTTTGTQNVRALSHGSPKSVLPCMAVCSSGWQDLSSCGKFCNPGMEMLWCYDSSVSAVRC